jgi:hypothetical protein
MGEGELIRALARERDLLREFLLIMAADEDESEDRPLLFMVSISIS